MPSGYAIGPGDVFVVHLFGRADTEERVEVGRDGRVLVPGVGSLDVAGLRFDEARSLIRTKIEHASIGEQAAVTIGDLRTLRVFVLGDVVRPGSYTVSGLSTMTNAIFASGGADRQSPHSTSTTCCCAATRRQIAR